MYNNTLTQDELTATLHYDPGTGVFTNLRTRANARIGSEAGAISGRGYRYIMVHRKLYLAHRLAFLWMTGEFPQDHVDHINGNRSDNRWENLRCASREENQKNRKLNCDNTSGYTGVKWHLHTSRWTATVTSNGKHYCIGYYHSKTDAVRARALAELHFGFHPNHGRR